MVVKQGTIGSHIMALAPKGWNASGYLSLVLSGKPEDRRTLRGFWRREPVVPASKLEDDAWLELVDRVETELARAVSDLVPKDILNDIPEDYRAPPYTVFDGVAVCGELIRHGGVYPHIEADVEDPSQRTETNRKLKRLIRVNAATRKALVGAAKSLSDDFRGVRSLHDLKKKGGHGAPLPSAAPIHEWKEGVSPFVPIAHLWATILRAWNEPVFQTLPETSEPPEWWYAAYCLFVLFDEAAGESGFRFHDVDSLREAMMAGEIGFWELLSQALLVSNSDDDDDPNGGGSGGAALPANGGRYVVSLSLANPDMVCVLPKSRTAPLGCTLRSLSLNLALVPRRGSIRTGWMWAQGRRPDLIAQQRPFNVLVVPYPFKLEPRHFKPVSTPIADGARWSTFAPNVVPFAKKTDALENHVAELIEQAEAQGAPVNAIVFPELALGADGLEAMISLCERHTSIEVLCAGMREYPAFDGVSRRGVPTNGCAIVTFSILGGSYTKHMKVFHEKHHRWRLTAPQIQDYDLASALDPSRTWWEDHHVVNRKLPILVMRDKWTFTSLICEDLARNDPARAVIEAVGPNLVFSLVMDGPQIPERWSARYATVLADDPGSAVLTVDSLGLVDRSNRGRPIAEQKRAIALWREDTGRTVPVILEDDSSAVVLTLSEFPAVDNTLDGRQSHNQRTSLRLYGVTQVGSRAAVETLEWGA